MHTREGAVHVIQLVTGVEGRPRRMEVDVQPEGAVVLEHLRDSQESSDSQLTCKLAVQLQQVLNCLSQQHCAQCHGTLRETYGHPT